MHSEPTSSLRSRIATPIPLAIAATFLLLFQARRMFDATGYDEGCYIDSLARFVGVSGTSCPTTGYFPGVALLWYPLSKLGHFIATASGTAPIPWLTSLAGLTSFICWGLSLFVVSRIFKHFQVERWPLSRWGVWAPILFVFSTPVLPFATIHGLMTHSGEFLLSTLSIYFLLKNRCWLALGAALWLTATRANGFPVFLLVFGRFLDVRQDILPQRKWERHLLLSTFVLASFAVILKVIRLIFFGGYSWLKGSTILSHFGPFGIHLSLIRPDYGLLWYAPWWLFVFGLGIACFARLSWISRMATLSMTLNFIYLTAHTAWLGHMSAIQLRYLIATAPQALLIFFELKPILGNRGQKIADALLWVSITTTVLNAWAGGGVYQYDHWESSYLLRRWLLEPVGASPVVFSILSLIPVTWLPDSILPFSKYFLRGPALWVTAISALAAIATLLRIPFLLKGSTTRLFESLETGTNKSNDAT